MKQKRRNILYIGASGFIGTRLIDITKEEFSIKNLDKTESLFHPELTTIGDIRNIRDIHNIMRDVETVVLLAAEHRDDISPTTIYYDVNSKGTENVLKIMDEFGVKNIIFTSTVAIYGLNKKNPNEFCPPDPFNHYGKSKWEAEQLLKNWYKKDPKEKSLYIIRPTVVFGERNRGNVYALLKFIASGKFIMVGKGENIKSLAYVGNIAAFLKFLLKDSSTSYKIYNYADKPDFKISEIVDFVKKNLNMKCQSLYIPYWFGLLGGYTVDLLNRTRIKKIPISSIRIKKFCSTTQFDTKRLDGCGFKRPYTLAEGLEKTIKFELIDKINDGNYFYSE